jgi:uncharacterized protein (DUF433 family)/predicted DNA-binding antitoxin AbrB/MazE fold protein
MSIQTEAVYENGVLRPLQPVPLAERQRVTVAIEAAGPDQATAFQADRPPLRLDEGGTIRVGDSRITLDLVVEQYESGMKPEEMVRAYDTLDLADAHAAIAYYLRHREEVQAYLKRRNDEAEALRAQIEAERPRTTREELLARRARRRLG